MRQRSIKGFSSLEEITKITWILIDILNINDRGIHNAYFEINCCVVKSKSKGQICINKYF